jgi:regulatory protein
VPVERDAETGGGETGSTEVRVARFADTAGPEAEPSPVARFDAVHEQHAAPQALFDHLDAPDEEALAAPVAPVDGLGIAPEAAPSRVAGFGDVDVPAKSAESAPRAVRLGDLTAGSATRRRPARRSSGAGAPAATDTEPAPLESGEDGSEGRGARRRGERSGRSGRAGRAAGGSGFRGAPKELDPDADPVAAAREICLRLLTDRARTRQELAQALQRRGVPDDAAGTVLERFDEVGLIDDAAFAGQWVRSRHQFRGLSRRAIAMELRRKGVADEVAGEALAEVGPESEERRARELVDRKLRSITVDTPEQRATALRRLVGMLARKGYGAGIAYRVVREALTAKGIELDEDSEPLD